MKVFAALLITLFMASVVNAQENTAPGRASVSDTNDMEDSELFDEQDLTFARWCRDLSNYRAERCDAERPSDIREFKRVKQSMFRLRQEYDEERCRTAGFRGADPACIGREGDTAITTPDVLDVWRQRRNP